MTEIKNIYYSSCSLHFATVIFAYIATVPLNIDGLWFFSSPFHFEKEKTFYYVQITTAIGVACIFRNLIKILITSFDRQQTISKNGEFFFALLPKMIDKN